MCTYPPCWVFKAQASSIKKLFHRNHTISSLSLGVVQWMLLSLFKTLKLRIKQNITYDFYIMVWMLLSLFKTVKLRIKQNITYDFYIMVYLILYSGNTGPQELLTIRWLQLGNAFNIQTVTKVMSSKMSLLKIMSAVAVCYTQWQHSRGMINWKLPTFPLSLLLYTPTWFTSAQLLSMPDPSNYCEFETSLFKVISFSSMTTQQ